MSDSDSSDFDLSVDPMELLDVSEEEHEEFLEKLEEVEPTLEDYAHAIETELESVNQTEFMRKMGLEVIMDYNVEIRPRS